MSFELRKTSHSRSSHRVQRLIGTVGAFTMAVMALAATPALADTESTTRISACSYAAYAPVKGGSNITGWGEKWGCGGVQWTLRIQRHTGGPFWQNVASNFATGDGWLSGTAGCGASGTYRTILESNAGHQTVSAHAAITC
jgi:hypothetical protein